MRHAEKIDVNPDGSITSTVLSDTEQADMLAAVFRQYPELRKLELFARTRRAGWSAWGNQA